MIIHRIADWRTWRKRFEILLLESLRPLNARVDVVTLLEVDVLEEIAANCARGNRVPKHLNTGNVRNCAFNRHQPFAQVFIDAQCRLICQI